MAITKMRGLTLKEVAADAGIPYRTLQEYSYRHEDLRNLAAEKVYDIAKVLDVDIEYLIGRKEMINSNINEAEYKTNKCL